MLPHPISMTIDQEYLEKIKDLGLTEVKENNSWLVLHVKGDGYETPKNWNVKVYANKKARLKLVTNDYDLLKLLIDTQDKASKEVV